MEDQREPTISELRQEVREIREDMKAQQPSLLGAVRTLLNDIKGWQEGTRGYPESAALGVVFAYLRPRLIVLVGSVFAAIGVALQLYVLVKQNDLIRQQNDLIREQGTALRAQTAAVLLNDVDSKPSETRLALLAAFGEIGFDSLVILSSLETEAGETARMSLSSSAARLSSSQAVSAFMNLLDRDSERMQEQPWPSQGAPELSPNYTIDDWLTVKRAGQTTSDAPTLYAARFAVARRELATDLKSEAKRANETDETDHQIKFRLVDLYRSIGKRQSFQQRAFGDLNLIADSVCHEPQTTSLTEAVASNAQYIGQNEKDLPMEVIVEMTVHKWCLGESSPLPAARDDASGRELQRIWGLIDAAERSRAKDSPGD